MVIRGKQTALLLEWFNHLPERQFFWGQLIPIYTASAAAPTPLGVAIMATAFLTRLDQWFALLNRGERSRT